MLMAASGGDMSALQNFFDSYDNDEMARIDDPVRYRAAVAQFMEAVKAIKNNKNTDINRIENLLCCIPSIYRRFHDSQIDSISKELISSFRKEFDARQLSALESSFGSILDIYFYQRERTINNFLVIYAVSIIEIARLSEFEGLWARIKDKSEIEHNSQREKAQRYKRFAYEKLMEIWKEAHPEPPKPEVVVTQVHNHYVAPGTPSYRGW